MKAILIITTFSILANVTMAEQGSPTEAIQKHRMGTITIKTTPGAKVSVKQLEHEFWFGTAISQNIFNGKASETDKEKYLSILKDNFNSAVHENALKWYSTERNKDQITYKNADAMLKWCEDNGLRVRGHAVFWSVDKYVQPWIKEIDDEALRGKMETRATDVLSRYKGRIPEYDVNNEMLHGHYYEKRLGSTIRHDMFDWCHKADPDAVLYVNDYSILAGRKLANYEKQIASLIKAGVPVGGIGLQGHFKEGSVDAARITGVLDSLAKFNLPIKITEFDINTKNEDIKARGVVDLYTAAFGHPAVNGILMWGFWEGSHWRPKAALWKKDWTPTKAAAAYRDLVYNQWWTSWDGVTDENGICKVKAFYGRHEVTVAGHARKVVWLGKKDGEQTVVVAAEQTDPKVQKDPVQP